MENNQFVSIKDQLELLNSEVDNILEDNESLTPEKLLSIANNVKESTNVPVVELTNVNDKLLSAPIESTSSVIQEATNSVNDLKELLISCRAILNKIYTQIVSLDVTDPRMIEASATFINSMKDTIQSFLELYRDEQNFLHGIILKNIDFEHKKALIKYKRDLDLATKTTDISSENIINYSQEELMKIINNS